MLGFLKEFFTHDKYKMPDLLPDFSMPGDLVASFEDGRLEFVNKFINLAIDSILMETFPIYERNAFGDVNIKNVTFSSGKPKMTDYNRLGARQNKRVDSVYLPSR